MGWVDHGVADLAQGNRALQSCVSLVLDIYNLCDWFCGLRRRGLVKVLFCRINLPILRSSKHPMYVEIFRAVSDFKNPVTCAVIVIGDEVIPTYVCIIPPTGFYSFDIADAM